MKLLAVLSATVLIACTKIPEAPSALVVAVESMPQNPDPRFATDATSARIGGLVFRGLTESDQNQRQIPDLALNWKQVDNHTIDFELRRDVTFSDGTQLTSRDVKATYESILSPNTASPKRQELAFLSSVEAPSPWTVRFIMREPYAAFLGATSIGILPADLSLRGSGPYRIASVEPDHEVRLDAVDTLTALRKIVFRVIPDEITRSLELKKGTIHFVQNGVEPENLGWLAADPRLCVLRSRGTTFQYIGLNLKDPFLARQKVRQALAHTINRQHIVKHLFGGLVRPADGLLNPSHWAYESKIRQYGYDPAQARMLLDEAGLPDPDGDGPAIRHRFSYKTTTLSSRRRLAEAIQAMFTQVGLGLEIETYEWGTFYGDVKRGSFELYGLAWVGVQDPDFFHSLLESGMTPPHGNNRGSFAHKEIDRLTILGRRTFDLKERRQIYSQIQRIVANEIPFIPLWWEDIVIIQDRRLCGFHPDPSGGLKSLATAEWTDTLPGVSNTPCGCKSR